MARLSPRDVWDEAELVIVKASPPPSYDLPTHLSSPHPGPIGSSTTKWPQMFSSSIRWATATASPERSAFPHDLDVFRVWLAVGDQQARAAFTLGAAWLREGNSGTFCLWMDIAFLRENWNGPIVFKASRRSGRPGGDVHPRGRYHRVEPSVLQNITASSRVHRVQGQREVTILFDSGIPTVSEQEIYLWMFGSSLATAFFLGRSGELLSCYGLSLGGEQGVEEALRALRADTEITLELSGYRNFVVALRHHQPIKLHEKINLLSLRGSPIITFFPQDINVFVIRSRPPSPRRPTKRRGWTLKRPCNSNGLLSIECLSLNGNSSSFSSIIHRSSHRVLAYLEPRHVLPPRQLQPKFDDDFSSIVHLNVSADPTELPGKALTTPVVALLTSYVSQVSTNGFLSRTRAFSSFPSLLTLATDHHPPRVASDSNGRLHGWTN
ncbi:hypothetical protein DFH94DRAFT_694110 [Russula ochroleuca]|uniref:FMN-dependent dehydrogenase domain-containing protein n=1 Tax=Russula ochroleuca TaxID=152965 RepID=A0A9P5MST8_9AGAM|nr:hypothetical protein DFH94DRAFT_694110 [Russula ochroleuca]